MPEDDSLVESIEPLDPELVGELAVIREFMIQDVLFRDEIQKLDTLYQELGKLNEEKRGLNSPKPKEQTTVWTLEGMLFGPTNAPPPPKKTISKPSNGIEDLIFIPEEDEKIAQIQANILDLERVDKSIAQLTSEIKEKVKKQADGFRLTNTLSGLYLPLKNQIDELASNLPDDISPLKLRTICKAYIKNLNSWVGTIDPKLAPYILQPGHEWFVNLANSALNPNRSSQPVEIPDAINALDNTQQDDSLPSKTSRTDPAALLLNECGDNLPVRLIKLIQEDILKSLQHGFISEQDLKKMYLNAQMILKYSSVIKVNTNLTSWLEKLVQLIPEGITYNCQVTGSEDAEEDSYYFTNFIKIFNAFDDTISLPFTYEHDIYNCTNIEEKEKLLTKLQSPEIGGLCLEIIQGKIKQRFMNNNVTTTINTISKDLLEFEALFPSDEDFQQLKEKLQELRQSIDNVSNEKSILKLDIITIDLFVGSVENELQEIREIGDKTYIRCKGTQNFVKNNPKLEEQLNNFLYKLKVSIGQQQHPCTLNKLNALLQQDDLISDLSSISHYTRQPEEFNYSLAAFLALEDLTGLDNQEKLETIKNEEVRHALAALYIHQCTLNTEILDKLKANPLLCQHITKIFLESEESEKSEKSTFKSNDLMKGRIRYIIKNNGICTTETWNKILSKPSLVGEIRAVPQMLKHCLSDEYLRIYNLSKYLRPSYTKDFAQRPTRERDRNTKNELFFTIDYYNKITYEVFSPLGLLIIDGEITLDELNKFAEENNLSKLSTLSSTQDIQEFINVSFADVLTITAKNGHTFSSNIYPPLVHKQNLLEKMAHYADSEDPLCQQKLKRITLFLERIEGLVENAKGTNYASKWKKATFYLEAVSEMIPHLVDNLDPSNTRDLIHKLQTSLEEVHQRYYPENKTNNKSNFSFLFSCTGSMSFRFLPVRLLWILGLSERFVLGNDTLVRTNTKSSAPAEVRELLDLFDKIGTEVLNPPKPEGSEVANSSKRPGMHYFFGQNYRSGATTPEPGTRPSTPQSTNNLGKSEP